MALRALRLRLRLRRTLTALPSISRSLSSPNPISVPSCSLLPGGDSLSSSSSPEFFHCRSFRSSAALLSSNRQYKLYKEGDEIDENTILFEGCDYNHWLIVVDFPRDKPKPPAGDMIQTYERICAQGLGVSIEEAKKRIYACSTTVYEGFQVEMTEEASKKFEDLPGVVFVLPDSYIDPVNKQYGGDKYENGVITPRPLPPQYNNYNRRRPRDRDDRGRYDQQGRQTQSWQQNPPYSHQGQPQGDGRNLGPQQGYPAQSYGSRPSVNNESYTPQPAMNNQSYRPPSQQSMSSQSYTQPPPMNNQNSAPQSPMNSQNYGIQPSTNNQNYGPGRRDPYQGDGSGTSPPVYRGNFSQDGQRNYHPQEQMGQGNVAPSGPVASPRFGQGTNTSYGQGNWQGTNPASGQGTSPGYIRQVPAQGSNPGSGHGLGPSYGQNYSQGENPGYGHGINTGSGQGPSPGYNSQVPGQGVNPGFGQGGDPSYGQGANPGYAHGDGQRLPHTEQSSPIGPAGTVQGRF